MDNIFLKNLDSELLKHLEYIPDKNILVVTFQNNNEYLYENVTSEIFETLKTAKSNPLYEYSYGKCFHRLIRNFPDVYIFHKIG